MDLSSLELEYSMDKRLSDNRVYVYIGMDLKDEFKKRVDSTDTRDREWTG